MGLILTGVFIAVVFAFGMYCAVHEPGTRSGRDATIAQLRALSAQWRIDSKPDPNGKTYIDLKRCADELDALLAQASPDTTKT